MAFLNLRSNNQLFILHKDNVPTLEIGKVLSVSIPTPKYGTPNMYNSDMIVDITADVNGTSTNFLKIPALSDIADFGNNIVVACNKEAMDNEINDMLRNSKQVIESIPLHKIIISSCEKILKELNPQFAKLLDLEEKINNLENKVGGIETKLDDLRAMLSEALKSK